MLASDEKRWPPRHSPLPAACASSWLLCPRPEDVEVQKVTTLLPVKSLSMAKRSFGVEGTLHMTYTMMQVCRELGMTYQTLKFYCNQGLVPYVKRDKNNRRVFDEHDVEWARSLTCLKRCGMSIEEMRDYLELCPRVPPASRSVRKCSPRSARLGEQMEQIQASMDYIDWKQGFYDDILASRTEYYSNLTPEVGGGTVA